MSVLKQHQDWMTKHYETLLNYKLVHFQIETDGHVMIAKYGEGFTI